MAEDTAGVVVKVMYEEHPPDDDDDDEWDAVVDRTRSVEGVIVDTDRTLDTDTHGVSHVHLGPTKIDVQAVIQGHLRTATDCEVNCYGINVASPRAQGMPQA